MSSIEIKKYTVEQKNTWNQLVKNAKNSTFLFERDFMDYHADRFEDFSLVIYEKQKPIAILPAHKKKGILYSHQGLTYGGLVFSKKLKFDKILEVFHQLLKFLQAENIEKLILKCLPTIYHSYPSDEVDYLLFLTQSRLIRTDLSSAIPLQNRLKIQSNRMEGVKKAQKQGLEIKKETHFKAFWEEILIPNLRKQHDAQPVHSLSEIELLASRFPNNIHQYNVYHNGKIVGGSTLFETQTLVHTQYISADENRQQLGTLDFLFQYLIEEAFVHKTYFDFGNSNENQGLNLNKGLLYWKECFGARGIVYPVYEVETKNHTLLENVFL